MESNRKNIYLVISVFSTTSVLDDAINGAYVEARFGGGSIYGV